MRFTISLEVELPTDDEGLTDEGWETVSKFQDAIWYLKEGYHWDILQHVGMPKRIREEK